MQKTREEHLEWCKKRVLAYINRGDTRDGLLLLIGDLRKHEETKDHEVITAIIEDITNSSFVLFPEETAKYIKRIK